MIGFIGKRHSGKDTASDYLVNKYGYTKRAFAEPLKLGLKELFGFTDEQLYTNKKEEIDDVWGISPRVACQVIGNDIVRDLFPKMLLPNIGMDFWIKRADIWYENNKKEHNNKIVWSDVRYQNEVDYILSKGGLVVKIVRPKMDNNDNVDEHCSETSLDIIDNYGEYIINDKLTDFYIDIDNLHNHIDLDK